MQPAPRSRRTETGCQPAAAACRRSPLALLIAVVVACPVLLAVWPSSAGAGGGFTETTVSASVSGDCKAVADFDRDGAIDIAVGGTVLRWFRNGATASSDGWAESPIADARVEFTTDCQAGDVDGDGDADLIVPDGGYGGGALLWFENRLATGETWVRHTIAESGYRHDVEVADLNGDGRLDVAARRAGDTSIYLQGANSDSWSTQTIWSASGEGLALGDVDTDGDVDVVAGGTWLANPTWAPSELSPTGWSSAAVADIDGDGRNDVVLCPLEAVGNDCSWYGRPDGAAGWSATLIAGDIGAGQHTIKVADLDHDGHVDVVAPRMHTYGGAITLYRQVAPASWVPVAIGEGGAHNVRLADFDRDGDLDVLAVNYIGAAGVRVLRNDVATTVEIEDNATPTVPTTVASVATVAAVAAGASTDAPSGWPTLR